MKNTIKKRITEKGQGLTEYVLILAFIAGVAMAMFGNGGLKTTVVNTLTDTVEILANLFTEPEPNSYRAAYAKYSKYNQSALYGNTETAEERLQADIDALKLIGQMLLDKNATKDDLKEYFATRLLNTSTDQIHDVDLETNGIGIINYQYNDYGYSSVTGGYERGKYSTTDAAKDAITAMTGVTDFNSGEYRMINDNYKTADHGGYTANSLFYSDPMISEKKDRTVKATFTFDGTGDDAKITSVTMFVSGSNEDASRLTATITKK